MHDLTSSFSIYGDTLNPTDVEQGLLGDCYLLAALASLANIRNGEVIKNAFVTKQDNAKHIYTTKWFIDGAVREVSVDEWIPQYPLYYNPEYSAFA
jgi:calpain-15